MKAKSPAILLSLLCCTLPLAALEVPALSAPVTDMADLLSADQAQQLNDLLLDYETETSNQFALLMYFEGISAGLLELIRQTGDEFSPDPALEPARADSGDRVGAFLFLIMPFLMMLVISIFLARNRAFSRLFKRKYDGLKGDAIRSAGMQPRLFHVWKKRARLQLKARVVGLAVAGVVPILPSLAMIPVTPVALLIPGLYLLALLIVPIIWRPEELPYNLSYKRIEDDYGKLKDLMKEVDSEEERQEMLKLFLAGYVSIALMRMVIQKKGHFDRKYYMSSFRSSSSGGSSSGSSFGGGGGSFGGGGASGGW